jgi:hypothetical protein
MSTLLLDEPSRATKRTAEQPEPAEASRSPDRWLVFRYRPVSLFSLKSSRATSTAGKTLLTPTPYAVKMAFLDAALRQGLTEDPDSLVRWLAGASVRIGVPEHACVTGTIQSIRQETRDVERKRKPSLSPYRASIGMREFVHYLGVISLGFDLDTCPPDLIGLLLFVAPAINYLGKRGSFLQYLGGTRQTELNATFTQPVEGNGGTIRTPGHRAVLDDFGNGASFDALNSFSPTGVQRGVHRRFVETIVPLEVHNTGPGFVHYCGPGAML